MIKDLVPPDSPILIQIAKPIPHDEIVSASTKRFTEKILHASLGRRKDKSKPMVVGLAAPQIGISKRIIAVDVKADGRGGIGDLQIFINPEITWHSEDREEWYEGCWSTGCVCGIEFVTHITDDNNLHWVEADEFPEYRNNEAWRTWTKKCPREKWEKIKGISEQ